MNKQTDFWSRVFTFLPTATNAGESIDQKRLFEEIDFQIENGVHGVCIFGSTSGAEQPSFVLSCCGRWR